MKEFFTWQLGVFALGISMGIMLIIFLDIRPTIKVLTTQESLEQAEIKTLQDHYDTLARIISPDYLKAIKDFTEQVKIQNEYLKDFANEKEAK